MDYNKTYLVSLFGSSVGPDKLVFLGRQKEIVLTLSEEVRACFLKFLSFCNGVRTLHNIRERVPEISDKTFEAIVLACIEQKIIVESREIFCLFHDDSSNPARFFHSLSDDYVSELVRTRPAIDSRGKNTFRLNEIRSGLLDLIRTRKSAGGFADEQISGDVIGGLFASLYEIRDVRSVPSAGQLYPLEIYILVNSDKQEMSRGLYQYDSDGHQLCFVSNAISKRTITHVLDSGIAHDCSLILFIVGNLQRVTAKYANRGYRYALIEAGHVAQNAYLYCAEKKLGIREFGGFQDKLVADVLGLSYPSNAVLTTLLISRPSELNYQDPFPALARSLKESLVGPDKPLEQIGFRALETPGKLYPRVMAICKFRSSNESKDRNIASGVSALRSEASVKAMAEGYERHVSGLLRVDMHARATDLPSAFFDPRVATSFTLEQLNALKLKSFDPNMARDWVLGKRWLSQEKVFVPVDHVFYPIISGAKQLLCYRANSSGVAAHVEYDLAMMGALRELIERDAIALTWYSRRKVRAIPSELLGSEVEESVCYWEKRGWKLVFLDLTVDSLPVVMTVFYSRTEYPAFVSGASSHSDRLFAANKALEEAETMLILALSEGKTRLVLPEQVNCPMDHGRLYFDPKNLHRVEWLLNSTEHANLPVTTESDLITQFDPVIVDLTPENSDVKLHVCRVLCERLLPINFGFGSGHPSHRRFEMLGLACDQEQVMFPHFFA